MPSMIERIAKAEEDALQIKRDAHAAARETVAAAESDAAKTVAAASEAVRPLLNEALAAAEKEGEALAAKIIGEQAQVTQEKCAAAALRLDGAVAMILERVKA